MVVKFDYEDIYPIGKLYITYQDKKEYLINT